MADLSSVETNFFPTASETFEDNLAETIGAGATTVPITNLTEYDDGDVVVLTVDPGTANEATFTGVVSGNDVTQVEWTEGNVGVGHDAGATVVDYDSATHINQITKGIKKFANQDGSLITAAVQESLGLGNEELNGWNALAYTFNTLTYNGNRSYTGIINGQNLTDTLSPGMRIRTTRTVAAPTQATSLNGTNQYWVDTTPAGFTFTDDFTTMAWVKLTSYQAGNIITRRATNDGFALRVDPSGRVETVVINASNNRVVITVQSLPLNKWVHVAAANDISAGSYAIYIDGIAVPVTSTSSGAMTAIVQAGNLEVGAGNAASFWSGKIAQAAVFSSILTGNTIKSYYSQGLSGTETSLVSAYSFNGNANDLNTTNANNLTAMNGVTATAADSPFGGQGDGTISSTLDYGIIQSVSFSTNTTLVFQVPEGCTVPTSGGVASVVYSSNKVPFGFPSAENKWEIIFRWKGVSLSTASIAGAWGNFGSSEVLIPHGVWKQRSQIVITGSSSTSSSFTLQTQWDTATPTYNRESQHVERANVAMSYLVASHSHEDVLTTSAITTYRLYAAMVSGSGTQTAYTESTYTSSMTITNAYL